jgi:serine/threonine-protein kinase PpkA
MSPEQATGKNMDGRSDLYSLGIVLYEMLTRRKPFQAEDAFATALMHINSPSPRLPEHFGFYQSLIDRLLAKDPNDRFDSAQQLIEAIDSLSKEVARVSETAATRLAPADAVAAERPKMQASRVSSPTGESGVSTGLGRGALALVLLLVAGLGGSAVYLGGTTSDLRFLRLLPQWFTSSPSREDPVSAGEQQRVTAEEPRADETQRLPDAESPNRAPEVAQKVVRLLEVAQAHAAFGRFKDPPGFNAYDAYQQVLELEPNNEDALRGLADIDRYEADLGKR